MILLKGLPRPWPLRVHAAALVASFLRIPAMHWSPLCDYSAAPASARALLSSATDVLHKHYTVHTITDLRLYLRAHAALLEQLMSQLFQIILLHYSKQTHLRYAGSLLFERCEFKAASIQHFTRYYKRELLQTIAKLRHHSRPLC
jgi:hypothetical protein